MKTSKVLFLLLLLMGYLSLLEAKDLSSYFEEGKNFGTANSSQAINSAQNADLSQVPGYKNDHPSEIQYRDQSPDELEAEGNKVVRQDKDGAGHFVKNSYDTRKKIEVQINDPVIEKADALIDQAPIVFEESKAFCRQGECTDTTSEPSPDFEEAISNLSAAAEGSKDIKAVQQCSGSLLHRTCKTYYRIFRGSVGRCRMVAMGYSNCCADHGWGQAIGLAGCHIEEEELGRKKEAHVCYYVGKYCSHKIAGLCRTHKKSYCCFSSKLGRIIHEQGRKQLHISWGSAKSPNCSGFTPEELQQIDFDRINFTEYYEDIERQMIGKPDIEGIKERIKTTAIGKIEKGIP